MAELKLRQLHRGYVLTDFEGNEVGVKDSEQAVEEIKNLLNGKNQENIIDEGNIQDSEQGSKEEGQQLQIQKVRYNRTELHRKIFELAKEQINLTGRTNAAEIARELGSNHSTVSNHINKMKVELDKFVIKWQDERDKKMLNTETITDKEGNKLSEDSNKLSDNDDTKLTE